MINKYLDYLVAIRLKAEKLKGWKSGLYNTLSIVITAIPVLLVAYVVSYIYVMAILEWQ